MPQAARTYTPDSPKPLDRRSMFAVLLAAPIIASPAHAASKPVLAPGHIWVQVPEQAWSQFLEAAKALEAFGRR